MIMIKLNINNKVYDLEIEGNETLLELLRDNLGLTGTKESCNEGECGACAIIIDGKSALSCCLLAADLEGREIETIENLSDGDNLHPIQESFLEMGAVQCGFCMPGMIMATKALLHENPKPSFDEIKKGLDGNLCRCAGYSKIFEAVEDAARKLSR